MFISTSLKHNLHLALESDGTAQQNPSSIRYIISLEQIVFYIFKWFGDEVTSQRSKEHEHFPVLVTFEGHKIRYAKSPIFCSMQISSLQKPCLQRSTATKATPRRKCVQFTLFIFL